LTVPPRQLKLAIRSQLYGKCPKGIEVFLSLRMFNSPSDVMDFLTMQTLKIISQGCRTARMPICVFPCIGEAGKAENIHIYVTLSLILVIQAWLSMSLS